MTWVLFAVVTFFKYAPNFLFKSYFDSENFEHTLTTYVENLGKYVLYPFDEKEAKEKLTVTEEEINYYRNYYGTLAEQINNIRTQYVDRIEQANEEKNNELEDLLIEERDKKIADITKNFQSDEYVEKKIREQKEKAIEKYAIEQERERTEFLKDQRFFSYSFIDIETGKEFVNGDVYTSNTFKRMFGGDEPYLIVNRSDYIQNYDQHEALFSHIELDGNVKQFEGSVVIPKKNMDNVAFKELYQNFKIAKIIFYLVWIGGIIALIDLFTKKRLTKDIFQLNNWLKINFLKLPIDVRIVFVIIDILITFMFIDTLGYSITVNIIYADSTQVFSILFEIMVILIFIFITGSTTILGAFWIFESVSDEKKLIEEAKGAMLYRLYESLQDLFIKRSVGLQTLVVLCIVFMAGWGLAIAMWFEAGDLFFLYFLCVIFIGFPATFHFLRRMGYLNRIIKQTEEMVDGRLTKEIKVKGKSAFAKHAANLNVLRERVKNSKTEQVKSERLKTELITNVSHDLRTPLTSIITYTDLLKNPHLSEEERNQYIDILDKKSARLKTLIEDLFEVSKMTSGNVQLTKGRIDVAQLLQQAIGEQKEAFTQNQLDLRLLMPDNALFANVDGKMLWRTIDNLLVNVLKYALEGTRVYISLKQMTNHLEFTVKNVSKYELGENVSELKERFKRADASRHTEGSGLGLAIAQSIIDLHEGELTIEVDGDLFKVTVKIPTI